MGDRRAYSIDLSASPESLSIIRLFVATVLRTQGADEDMVGDAKLAVSELATSSVQAGVDRLTVSLHSSGAAVEISVIPFTGPAPSTSPDPVDVAMALFSNLTIESESGAARFSIALAPT